MNDELCCKVGRAKDTLNGSCRQDWLYGNRWCRRLMGGLGDDVPDGGRGGMRYLRMGNDTIKRYR